MISNGPTDRDFDDFTHRASCSCSSGIFGANRNVVGLTISAKEERLGEDHPFFKRVRSLERRGLTRRSFIRGATVAIGGFAAVSAALSPLLEVDSDSVPSLSELLQKHYKEMTAEDKKRIFARIEERIKDRYGRKVNIKDPPPIDDVEFVYALNLTRCNGNRACVHACMKENNQSRSPEMQYIRVLELPKGTLDVEQSDHYYEGETVPHEGKYYMPVQCHQCADAPCVKVCPVEATWIEPDGITVVDYDWCIGCRYCEAACPYWARRFNFTQPVIPEDQINPNMGYLSNRIRHKGVMEKCTFCLHRTREGRMPACLEACPTGARKFGNILDPNSEVSQILRTKRIFVLKEDVGTHPRFFYYFDEREPRLKSPPEGPRIDGKAQDSEASAHPVNGGRA